MSNAKFTAAQELIKEGNYDAARSVLHTLDHPTAIKWLRKIDQLDPPFPNVNSSSVAPKVDEEREKYYKRENRKARRQNIGARIQILVLGLMALFFWFIFSGIPFNSPSANPFGGTNLFLLGTAIGAILLSIFGKKI